MENLFSLIIFIFGFFIVMNLIVELFLFLFLYIEVKLAQIDDPKNVPYPSTFRFIKNFIKEYFFVMSKYLLYPMKYVDMSSSQDLLEDMSVDNRTVIILLHGYSRSQTDWLYFMRQFKDSPYPMYALNLTPQNGPIEQISETLGNKINEVKKTTMCENIVLVCHSMGGLVASYYAENLDKDQLVRKIIVLGTPFNGTKVALTSSCANVQQMVPKSKFLTNLQESIAVSKVEYFQVLTKMDNIVFPWHSSVLNEIPEEKRMILDYESHQGLMYNVSVREQIAVWLRQ